MTGRHSHSRRGRRGRMVSAAGRPGGGDGRGGGGAGCGGARAEGRVLAGRGGRGERQPGLKGPQRRWCHLLQGVLGDRPQGGEGCGLVQGVSSTVLSPSGRREQVIAPATLSARWFSSSLLVETSFSLRENQPFTQRQERR